MDTAPIDDLTDALARGRLTAAEIAGLTPRELDAVFAVGAQRLDTGRYAEAEELFAGLAALFPYAARIWRAWGIALHCQLHCARARAAYDAALLLEPGHLETIVYRGEVLLYLGETVAARRDLQAAARGHQPEITRRAMALLVALDRLGGWQARPATPVVMAAATPFALPDGRTLPLEHGRFDDAADARSVTREITQTARLFAPPARRLDDAATAIADEPTDTAIVARPQAAEHLARLGDTGTDLLPGRPGAMARADTAPLASLENTDTGIVPRGDTAVVRRRQGQPLGVAPTAPPADPEDDTP